MRTHKNKIISAVAIVILPLCQIVQAEEPDDNKFHISGDMRAGLLEYDYSNPDGLGTINKGHRDSQGFYIIPKLSLNTPVYHGFSGKLTVAGATDFGVNGEERQSRLFVFDGVEKKSFAILQELFIEYNDDIHHLLIGRNEFVTPMIEADDYYMLANSFSVASYKNTSFDNTALQIGYFHEMAGVWDSGANGTEFHAMSDASFVPQINKDEAGDKGVLFASLEYDNDVHHAQLWNYYAPDLYNTLFAQYDYKMQSEHINHDFGVQFINFSEVGKLKSSDTEIDFNIVSLKYDAAFDNGWSLATGAAKYSDGDGQGSTLGAWGGFPYFANGMIFHFFEAGSLRDAASFKIQGGYDFSKHFNTRADLSLRYTYYDLNPEYSISSDDRGQDDMQMIGVRMNYSFLDGGYFTGTFERHKIAHEEPVWALRLIGGYRF